LSGDRRQETGDRRQETGVRRQESGVRSQETGVRSQETEDRRHLISSADSAPEAPLPLCNSITTYELRITNYESLCSPASYPPAHPISHTGVDFCNDIAENEKNMKNIEF
jgi:hypothetical protein